MYEELIRAGIPEINVKRILAYFNGDKSSKAVWELNNAEGRYNLAVKYHNLGLVLDGVNVAITGRNVAFVTWVGYKNKVLSVYPEAKFDVQLVREGDEFNFEKNSGIIKYSHKMNNPFGNKPIIGTYAFVKTKRGQYIEFLDSDTYALMKNSSRNQSTWEKWESEFWLKSVIKRVCKRNFYDVVAEIEKVDNEDYNMTKSTGKQSDVEILDENISSAIEFINESSTIKELQERWLQIDNNIKAVQIVEDAKDRIKDVLVEKELDNTAMKVR